MTREEIKDFCDMKVQLEPENEDIFKAIVKELEQEPQSFKWCTDCKEYDQEKHCCHRWSKVIRDTVEEMKREPIIDKIRAEIDNALSDGMIHKKTVLGIIDKYKAERTDNAEV